VVKRVLANGEKVGVCDGVVTGESMVGDSSGDSSGEVAAKSEQALG
jgi:hypothetical protein